MAKFFFGISVGAVVVALILFASFPAFYSWLKGEQSDIERYLLKGLFAFVIALVICYLAS